MPPDTGKRRQNEIINENDSRATIIFNIHVPLVRASSICTTIKNPVILYHGQDYTTSFICADVPAFRSLQFYENLNFLAQTT